MSSNRFPRLGFGPIVVMVVAAVAAGMVASAGPLFLASVGNAALQREFDSYGDERTGATLQMAGLSSAEVFAGIDQRVRQRVRSVDGLGSGVVTVVGPSMPTYVGEERAGGVRLLARSGASREVVTLSQAAGEGLWLPETTDVVQLGISAGDSISYEFAPVDDPARRPEVLVERVYRDLTMLPPSDFWETLGALVYGNPDADEFPEQIALAEPVFLMDFLYRSRYGEPVAVTWNFPLVSEGLTLPAARDRAAALQGLQDEVYDRSSELHTALSDLVYREAYGSRPGAASLLPAAIRAAERTRTEVASPVWGQVLLGGAAALAATVASTLFVVHGGRREVLFRVAQGRGYGWFARHAVALAAGPMLLGCIAGWVLTFWLVPWLGPSPLIEPADAWVALGWTLCAFLASVIACGLSAVLGVRALARPSLRRNRLAAVPWSLLAMVLAGAAFLQLARDNAFFVTDGSQPPVANVLTLAFAPLAVAALVGAAMRLARTLLPRLRHVPSSSGAVVWLVARRLAGASTPALLLVGVMANGFGAVAYATAISGSTETSVDAKVATRTGAEVVGVLYGTQVQSSPDLGLPSTVVGRSRGQLEGDAVDVLAVDPASIVHAADVGTVVGAGAAEMLERLGGASGARVPAVLVGDGSTAERRLDLRVSGAQVAVNVVGTPDSFPGKRPGTPLVVLPWRQVDGLESVTSPSGVVRWHRELWARGTTEEVRAAAEAEGLFLLTARDDSVFLAAVEAQEIRWSQSLYAALGGVTLVLASSALFAYAYRRRRSDAVVGTLTGRMRMSPRSWLAVLTIEMVTLAMTAFLIGATAGLIVAGLVISQWDLLPQLPPARGWRSPSPHWP